MRKPKTFIIGDRVAYAAAFLKSTGQHTGNVPFQRGTVLAVMPFAGRQLCTIQWSINGTPIRMKSEYHNDGFGRVISPNLTLIARIAEDAALAG